MDKDNYEIKSDLRKAFARHRLDVLAGFSEVPYIEIPEIPKERTLFPNTTNDYWQLIETSDEEDMTSCRYDLDANRIFHTHIHFNNSETITLLTPNSKVEWVTEEGIFFYEYPAKFTVPRGIEHAIVSLVDFPISYRVDWKPAMHKGWNAQFKEKINK